MKAKGVLRIVVIVFIILFFGLYFSQLTGYYEYKQSTKTALTKEAIERFENDVAEGKEIIAKNYIQEEKNYDNKASQFGMGLSNLIEKGFNKAMKALFSEIDKAIKTSD